MAAARQQCSGQSAKTDKHVTRNLESPHSRSHRPLSNILTDRKIAQLLLLIYILKFRSAFLYSRYATVISQQVRSSCLLLYDPFELDVGRMMNVNEHAEYLG